MEEERKLLSEAVLALNFSLSVQRREEELEREQQEEEERAKLAEKNKKDQESNKDEKEKERDTVMETPTRQSKGKEKERNPLIGITAEDAQYLVQLTQQPSLDYNQFKEVCLARYGLKGDIILQEVYHRGRAANHHPNVRNWSLVPDDGKPEFRDNPDLAIPLEDIISLPLPYCDPAKIYRY